MVGFDATGDDLTLDVYGNSQGSTEDLDDAADAVYGYDEGRRSSVKRAATARPGQGWRGQSKWMARQRQRAASATLVFRLSLDETLDCGEDTGTPVNEDYHVAVQVHRRAQEGRDQARQEQRKRVTTH